MRNPAAAQAVERWDDLYAVCDLLGPSIESGELVSPYHIDLSGEGIIGVKCFVHKVADFASGRAAVALAVGISDVPPLIRVREDSASSTFAKQTPAGNELRIEICLIASTIPAKGHASRQDLDDLQDVDRRDRAAR
jgi:hypothetical protein